MLQEGPTTQDISVLRSTTIAPATQSLTLPPEEAYTLVHQALQGHVRARISCLDSRRLMTTREKEELPFKVFNEIDREYFRATLKGNVSICWSRLRKGVYAQTKCADVEGNPRIQIDLSPMLGEYGHRCDILAALVHQMIHAYYLQCCGHSDKENSGTGHVLGHGLAFLALRKCIIEHCWPLQEILLRPLLARYLAGRRRLGYSGVDDGKRSPGVSYCPHFKDRYNSVDVQDWRNTAVAKTVSLQDLRKASGTSQSVNDKLFPTAVYFLDREGKEEPPKSLDRLEHPREAYIFLRFEGRHYPLLRSAVADLTALTKSPHFKDKAFLQLPAKTSQEDFLTFALFLVHRVCPPLWKGCLGQATGSSQGAPVIDVYNASAPRPLLQLIGAFHLEEQLKYKPFQDHIISQLRGLQSTAEDPMAVLEKIYDSRSASSSTSTSAKSADPQLRDWVRAWLAVDLISAGKGQHEMAYKTNLGVLRDNERWSPRLILLRGKCTAFDDDEQFSNNALCRRFRVGQIRDIRVPLPMHQDLGQPLLPFFSQLQPPVGNASWFHPNGSSVEPQWNNNNILQHIRDNPNTFDLTDLQKFLPTNPFQGFHSQTINPADRNYRMDDLQAIVERIRQEEQSRNTPNIHGPNISYNNLPPQPQPQLQQWGIGARGPGS
ncbi:MAG: hypothetical protein Q9176_007957 [Flavoplaca citrina]